MGCLDNFYTGSRSNIDEHINHPGFVVIEQNVIEPINLNIDEIYNLVCLASPVHDQKEPTKSLKPVLFSPKNLLRLARDSQAKILQTLTSEVCGNPEIHPQTESYWSNADPVGVQTCYDEGKRCAETLFFDANRQYDVNIKFMRIFKNYGLNMRSEDSSVVCNFIM